MYRFSWWIVDAPSAKGRTHLNLIIRLALSGNRVSITHCCLGIAGHCVKSYMHSLYMSVYASTSAQAF